MKLLAQSLLSLHLRSERRAAPAAALGPIKTSSSMRMPSHNCTPHLIVTLSDGSTHKIDIYRKAPRSDEPKIHRVTPLQPPSRNVDDTRVQLPHQNQFVTRYTNTRYCRFGARPVYLNRRSHGPSGLPQILPHLMLPVRPVVAAHVTPVIQMVADPAARQDVG